MNSSPNSRRQIFSYLFGILVGITILVWVLRGLQILSFSGGVIWVLLLLSISIGVIRFWQQPRRY